MSTIEEILKLKSLLDQGAITQDEYNLMKEKILSQANEPITEIPEGDKKESIPEKEVSEGSKNYDKNPDRPNIGRKSLNKKDIYQKYIAYSSFLLLGIIGIILGRNELSFTYLLILVPIILIVFFALLKILNLVFSKLTSSIILISIPIVLIVLSIFHINIFSKYIFNSNLQKIVTFQYDDKEKKIPCEVYYIRKDSSLIEDSDTLYIMTGMYKSYNENGKLVANGRLEDGICRGKWLTTEYDDDEGITWSIQFDDEITYESMLKMNEQYEINSENNYSYSDDIIGGSLISRNGYIETFSGIDRIEGQCNAQTRGYFFGGIPNGDITIFYNNKIWLKGKTKYGYLDGEFKYYTPEGKVYKTFIYENGILSDIKVNDENIKTEPVEKKEGEGRIIASRLFTGNYHGSYKRYDKYGELIEEGFYLDGNPHGDFKFYGRFCGNYNRRDCSYQLKRITPFYNGYLHGLQTSYWSDQGNYSDAIGDVINYTKMYRYGKQHGKFTKFSSSASYDNGHIWYTEEYNNGMLVENSKVEY